MSPSKSFNRRLLLLSLAILSVVGVMPVCHPTIAWGAVLKVEPAPNVDERLFLTYVANDLHAECPALSGDGQQVQQELAAWRLQASRFQEYVKDRNFDPKLTSIYADLLTTIDLYTDFLASTGRIEREAVEHVEQEREKTSFDAGYTGGSVGYGAYENGASGGDAIWSALLTGAVQWLLEDAAKGQEIDKTKRQDIEAAGQQCRAQVTTIIARLNNAEMDLASQYGWGKGEVRSSDPPEEAGAWQDLSAANDINGQLALLDRKIAGRPRDPMLLCVREYVASCDANANSGNMRSNAEQCVKCAALVPGGAIYDEYRAEILWIAGDIANRAWAKELEGSAWGTAHSPIAAYAVDVWDTLLSYEPSDATGECRERRAWALMASGRIDEAVKQVNEIATLRRDTIRAAMNMARLANATGEIDVSYGWFEHAVKDLHFNDIASARTDPDLAAMRHAKAAPFNDLVQVKWAWQIDYGFFNDDIVATNNSAFPITNVVLTCTITANGQSWNPVLNVDVIQPGQSYKWENCVSIPGSHADSAGATLTCDQNR